MEYTNTDKAPAAIGPYSQAVAHNGLLFVSGQIPVNPTNGELVEQTIYIQTRQVMENIKAILEANNIGFEQVLKTTCMLDDIKDFDEFNKIYADYFVSRPARSTFAVKSLPKKVLVEVDLIAALN